MAKFDYKSMKLEDMEAWVTENESKLASEKKELLIEFLKVSLGEDGKKNTLKAKKPFYELAKDYVEFDNPPVKKAKKVDTTVQNLKALREKYGI